MSGIEKSFRWLLAAETAPSIEDWEVLARQEEDSRVLGLILVKVSSECNSEKKWPMQRPTSYTIVTSSWATISVIGKNKSYSDRVGEPQG